MFVKPMGEKRNVKVGLTAEEARVFLDDLNRMIVLREAELGSDDNNGHIDATLDRLVLLRDALAGVVAPGEKAPTGTKDARSLTLPRTGARLAPLGTGL